MNEPLKPINTSFYDIQAFADANGLAYDEAFAELLRWYDGYQFSPERLVEIINPVSLGNALSNRVLRNYWEATAGSTLIFDALKAKNAAPIDFADEFEVATLYRAHDRRGEDGSRAVGR